MYDMIIYARRDSCVVAYIDGKSIANSEAKSFSAAAQLVMNADARTRVSFENVGVCPDMMSKEARELEQIVASHRIASETRAAA